MNQAQESKPRLWWRLVGHRLPWNRGMPPWERDYGLEPYVVQVRRNGITIGHHCVDSWQATTVIEVDRWDALYGLTTGQLRFEVLVRPSYEQVAHPSGPVPQMRDWLMGTGAGEQRFNLWRQDDAKPPAEWDLIVGDLSYEQANAIVVAYYREKYSK